MCRTLKTADTAGWTNSLVCLGSGLCLCAAYVKVDFSRINPLERRELLCRLRHFPVALIAEKVVQEQFTETVTKASRWVRGSCCKSVLPEAQSAKLNRLSAQVEILRHLNDENMSLHKLTELVKRDASLTYRLLRLINSPVCAMQQEVKSVQAALLAVRKEMFPCWRCSPDYTAVDSGQPLELHPHGV